MKVTLNTNLNFKRRLHPTEEADFALTLNQAKQKLGNTGHSILIIPSASLPQNFTTGAGNLLDSEGQKFIDFAKQYWGINYIQVLPEGIYKTINGNSYLPYSGSSLDLGQHLINLELLTKEEAGKLISKDEISIILSKQTKKIDFENVIAKNSPVDRLLRKAYNELLKADTETKKDILVQITKFKESNKSWLEPKAIFEALCAKYQTSDINCWNEFDASFYNTDVVSLEKRLKAIEGIKNSELRHEMGFYEFKQFFAEKHLLKAKNELNQKGIKISGDALAGFSKDEIWANPKAFIKGKSIGYGLPALNLEAREAEILLRQKFNNFAKRYDGIRIDMSWAYVTQPLEDSMTKNKTHIEYGEKFLSIIEDEIKKVKGSSFDLENITHEMIADPNDFNLFQSGEIKPYLRKRNKIFYTMNLAQDWATVENFKKRGWENGSYVLGTTNHDSETLRETFANLSKRTKQIETLSSILKIPKEKMNNFATFMQAKFAEPMRSKHNMLFFTEALNLTDKYKDVIGAEDYRLKTPTNYQNEYFKSLEKGEGFNVMDALEKAFIADGLDKKEPDLYKKIVKYKKILQSSKKGFNKWIAIGASAGIGVLTGIYILHNKRVSKPDSFV